MKTTFLRAVAPLIISSFCLGFVSSLSTHPAQAAITTESDQKKKNASETTEELDKLLDESVEKLSSGLYSEAEEKLLTAIQLAESIKDEKRKAVALNHLGVTYDYLGNYTQALKHLFRALKLREIQKDTLNIANICENIGIVYDNQGRNDLAIRYYQKALGLYEKRDDSEHSSGILHNIAGYYLKRKKLDEALEKVRQAYRINLLIDKKDWQALNLSLIGNIYREMKNNDSSLFYFQKSLALSESLNDVYGATISIINISDIHSDRKQYEPALELLKKALSITKGSGALDFEKEVQMRLSAIYEWMDGTPPSLAHYKEYISIRDSIYNIENTRKDLESRLQHDYDMKEINLKAEHEKKEIRNRNIRNSILAGSGALLVFLIIGYKQRKRLAQEKKRSESLLLNILPEEVAEELKNKGEADAQMLEEVTVLFTDFKDFTTKSALLTPDELVKYLHCCFTEFDKIIQEHGLEKIKTIGDSYMAAGGLPTPNSTHAEDVTRAGLKIADFMESEKEKKMKLGQPYFEVRVGIHSGPVVAGIVGVKKFQYDIWGDTVNTASRMESSGEVGKVNISQRTYELIKDIGEFQFESRGRIDAKGKGEMEMWFVRHSLHS